MSACPGRVGMMMLTNGSVSLTRAKVEGRRPKFKAQSSTEACGASVSPASPRARKAMASFQDAR